MASSHKHLPILVILSLIAVSSQSINDNKVDSQDDSPFAEAAAAIMNEQNLQNIGSMVSNLMQSGAAKDMVGSLLQNAAGSPQAADLLQGLGGVLASAVDSSNKKEGSSGDVLDGLGSLLGALPGGEGGDASAAVLQGLGSLIAGAAGGNKQKEGLDPALLGTMFNMFVNSQKEDKPKSKQKKSKKMQQEDDSNFDMGDILSLAGSFLGGSKQGGGGNFMQYIPMLMNTISAFTGPEAQQRADGHSGHASFIPPVIEKLHLMFDNFIHSDMGKMVMSSIGVDKAFKMFIDENGRFSYVKFIEMTENHSFRRHWIRMITDKSADILKFFSNPKTYQEYISTGQLFVNSFFRNQGFPKNALLDANKPVESISAFINYGAKKYFDVRFQSKEYVKPVVLYIQELLDMSGKKSLSESDRDAISNKIADTINLELIEPMTRVHRAYRFAKQRPSCDRYVFCLINQPSQNEENLPSLKKMLYRGSSLLAYWYLSDTTETPFWTIYSDIFDGIECKTLHLEQCNDFHEEELKVTTEYVHTEL